MACVNSPKHQCTERWKSASDQQQQQPDIYANCEVCHQPGKMQSIECQCADGTHMACGEACASIHKIAIATALDLGSGLHVRLPPPKEDNEHFAVIL